jgi:hypothetical protein
MINSELINYDNMIIVIINDRLNDILLGFQLDRDGT